MISNTKIKYNHACFGWDSNPGSSDDESGALPVELSGQSTPRANIRACKRQNYIFFGVFMPKYHQMSSFSTFRGQRIRLPAFYH